MNHGVIIEFRKIVVDGVSVEFFIFSLFLSIDIKMTTNGSCPLFSYTFKYITIAIICCNQ
ncbi:Uncharacterised protein [Vibrio cholerae]|nr:Uncharacterised protein [Vibrio cholerae]